MRLQKCGKYFKPANGFKKLFKYAFYKITEIYFGVEKLAIVYEKKQ